MVVASQSVKRMKVKFFIHVCLMRNSENGVFPWLDKIIPPLLKISLVVEEVGVRVMTGGNRSGGPFGILYRVWSLTLVPAKRNVRRKGFCPIKWLGFNGQFISKRHC